MIVENADIIKNSLMNEQRNQIKIASFGSNVINKELINLCKDDNYNVEYTLVESGTVDAIHKVKANEVDIAFVMFSEKQFDQMISYVDDKDLDMTVMFTGTLCIRVSEHSFLANREKIYTDDLQGKLLVVKDYQNTSYLGIEDIIQELKLNQCKKMIVNGKLYYDALKDLDSFAIDASWSCKWSINSELKRIKLANNVLKMYCAFVKKRNMVLKDEIKQFIKRLNEAYGGK